MKQLQSEKYSSEEDFLDFVADQKTAMSKKLATQIHAIGHDENLDPWLNLEQSKVSREEEIEFRTHIENMGRKKVIHHTNESLLARMKKEMRKREQLDKCAYNFSVGTYCVLYKTFIITGSEVLLPQCLTGKPEESALMAKFADHLAKCQSVFWRTYCASF